MTRVNAMRSGGPRSPSGKLVAAGNALKTGVYAVTTIILPGESESEFNQLLEQFVRDFAPSDIAEATMVRDLAILVWKKQRLDRIEHAALMRELDAPFRDYEFASFTELNAKAANSMREIGSDMEALERAYNMASGLHKEARSDELITHIEAAYPLLYEAIRYEAEVMSEKPLPRDKWASRMITTASGRRLPFIEYVANIFISSYMHMEWVFDHTELAQAQMSAVLETRLMKFTDMRLKSRTHDDLDRSFYRSLSELRKHQGWRRSISEITVNPEPSITRADDPAS